MAWDEWERLKAAAAERQSAHTQLNHVPADQGGTGAAGVYGPPSGNLRSDKAAWSNAGEGLNGLRDNVGKALAKMEDGQTGMGQGTECLTAAAQRGVYESWERRVGHIGELCIGLASVLEKTGNDQLRTDDAIKDEIAGLKIDSKDVPLPAKDR